jgi:hypothetical protein
VTGLTCAVVFPVPAGAAVLGPQPTDLAAPLIRGGPVVDVWYWHERAARRAAGEGESFATPVRRLRWAAGSPPKEAAPRLLV